MPPPSRKRWLLREADPLAVVRQSEQLKVSPLLARILILRGYCDSQSAKRYLSSSLREDLPSPFEMIDMEPAFGGITTSTAPPALLCWYASCARSALNRSTTCRIGSKRGMVSTRPGCGA